MPRAVRTWMARLEGQNVGCHWHQAPRSCHWYKAPRSCHWYQAPRSCHWYPVKRMERGQKWRRRGGRQTLTPLRQDMDDDDALPTPLSPSPVSNGGDGYILPEFRHPDKNSNFFFPQNGACLVGEVFPHPVGVFCTHLEPPNCHILKKRCF